MATPPHCPLPTNLPLFLGVGPSHRHTPVLIVERVVGGAPTAWNKETKPHGPPAHLSSPWTGSSCSHSPASTRPPTRGGGGGGWGAEVRQPPPFLCPLPSAQARTGYQDRSGLRWADGGTNRETASLPARIWGDRDTGAQRETEPRVGDPQTELGQPGSGGGLVGKVGGRQQGAKPFPFMETIFSKNKQFRCRATRELPAPHPGPPRMCPAQGLGGAARIESGWRPRKSWGWGEEVRGGAGGWKGERQSGPLTNLHPQTWRVARVLLSPTLTEFGQSFLLSDL